MTAPKLDPRPARTDLTSRECAKLIGGTIAALVHGEGRPPEDVRAAVRFIAAAFGEGGEGALAHFPTEGIDRMSNRLIAGTAGALAGMASNRALVAALLWWAEVDEAWVHLSAPQPEGLPS